jgi:hypothetical protein
VVQVILREARTVQRCGGIGGLHPFWGKVGTSSRGRHRVLMPGGMEDGIWTDAAYLYVRKRSYNIIIYNKMYLYYMF